jgi:hypothetical protein
LSSRPCVAVAKGIKEERYRGSQYLGLIVYKSSFRG